MDTSDIDAFCRSRRANDDQRGSRRDHLQAGEEEAHARGEQGR
ncbi:MAG TPA: hypothetical protein VGK15_00160 [Candidatus Limnocylindria bacterium]